MEKLNKTLLIIFIIFSLALVCSIFAFYTMALRTASVQNSFNLFIDDCNNTSNFYKDHNIELDEKFIEDSSNDIK